MKYMDQRCLIRAGEMDIKVEGPWNTEKENF